MICGILLSPLAPLLFAAISRLHSEKPKTTYQTYVKGLLWEHGDEVTAEILVHKWGVVGSLEKLGTD